MKVYYWKKCAAVGSLIVTVWSAAHVAQEVLPVDADHEPTRLAIDSAQHPLAAPNGSGAAAGKHLPWLGLLGLAGFCRVDRSNALEHPRRQMIHQAVEAEPGIHVEALSAKLSLARGVVLHHLEILEQTGIIQVRRLQGFMCIFAGQDIGAAELKAAPVIRSKTARHILSAVRDAGQVSLASIALEVKRSKPTVHYHMDRLRNAGLITASVVDNLPLHAVTQLGDQILGQAA